ncbi:DUF4838 domain-containing protein [Candidatus Latescibacterota bacterium]
MATGLVMAEIVARATTTPCRKPGTHSPLRRRIPMRFLCALLLLSLAMAPAAAGVAIVKGDTQALIVYEVGAEAETMQAIQDLSEYLERATGRTFAAVPETELGRGESRTVIYVGKCAALPEMDQRDLETMDRDAYLVHVTGNAVYLAGPSPWATYWAVCQFLEDHAGVRWLIPGKLGEDVPTSAEIAVPEMRRIYAPAILSRLWSGAHHGGPWSLRQRIHGRYRFHHNLLRIFDPVHYDEHPEWFPLRAGERYRPGREDHSWQPCLASQSCVVHAADAARQAFAEDPELESFSYGCNDGQGWCECEACRAMDRETPAWDGFEGTYSYRYYTWLNRVAEELATTHLGKMLGCLAYSTYILPPEDIGLHPSIIPYLTSNRADYWEQEFRLKDQELLEWWGRVANQVGIYDYAYGMGFAVPRIYNHLFQEAIEHAIENGVRGFYAEVYPNWGLDGPKLYTMARILWDPEVDVDAITGEWNKRMFREAAGPMKAYFARCERAWREQRTGRGHWAYRLAGDPKQFQVFPPEVLAECTRYLDEAARLARTQLVRDRIHFFRKTWDVTQLLAGRYWAAREVEELIAAEADLDQVAAAMREMADRLAATDIDAYMEARVGDDPVAFHPPKQAWISPLKGGAETNAKRWAAAHLSGQVVGRARERGLESVSELRQEIGARAREVFGSGGSEAYRTIVGEIATMADKVAKVVRVDEPVRIDGRLDEAIWARADEITGFSQWGQTSPAQYTTRAWLAHDGQDLYVALECPQDTGELRTEAAPRDGYGWRDDSVELFINPEMAELPHVQFIITAGGAFFDQWGRQETESYTTRLSADFSAEWAAQVDDGGWTAEMRLPLAEFDCSPGEHPMLRVDIVRNVQGSAPEISAWFPSVGAHADPLSRGWVVFE